jgi:hypothetical protein
VVSVQPSAGSDQPRTRDLADAVIALAGTPDDASTVDDHLVLIARLAAATVPGVDYASITALRGAEHTTVAASDEIARAVDEAQYDSGGGPCMEADDTGNSVTVPDIAATMSWPGFVQAAMRMGLSASVSIPLYAGRGAPVAVLNLYGRDPAAMAPLVAAVDAMYDLSADGDVAEPPELPAGTQELFDGLAEAIAVRATIQVAIAAVMARSHRTADEAYLALRMRAAETRTTLAETASALITGST